MGAPVRAAAILLALALVAAPSAQRFEPFVPIGVWYDGLSRPSSIVLHDLQAIRTLGFNHIKVPVAWGAIEPERGKFGFDRLDQLLTLAGESGLKVIVQPDVAAQPAWVDARAPAYMNWYAAFGLLVTLVWLYLEILRLLAKTRR